NVSHELKTPIGALIALAETLEVDDDAEVMKRLAGRVLHEAERLGRIVDDLLDLSVLEVQAAPDRSAARIADVISEAVDRLAPAARTAGAELTIAEVSEGSIVCDRRQIVSALCNLLENGLKYLDDGEEAVRAVAIGASRDGTDVVFHVTDTGIGIPESDRERIFERFYRVDRARSRQTGGTGLGLAIVRHVAHVHGGSTQVRSEEGAGSTFLLVIPSGLSEGPPMQDASP
ncbi:MAG TPA: ATP-binding protein, partial [Acidimicrobiia bacterium]|nr:ATP-binding protein [Acidimicrobiia bacterium]